MIQKICVCKLEKAQPSQFVADVKALPAWLVAVCTALSVQAGQCA
jgi:hypothetical protein